MEWIFNSLPLRAILEGIMEFIGGICNTNDEVVCGRNGNNHPECRF